MADKIARQRALEWWRERAQSGKEVNIKALSHVAAKELANDPDFCAAFLDDFLQPAMYELGLRVAASTRASLRTTSGLRRQVEEDAKREARKWDRWLEYVPDLGVHIPLLNMTREQAILASSYRREIAKENEHEARWFEMIARGMRPGQQVGDVYTDDELQKLREQIVPARIRKAA